MIRFSLCLALLITPISAFATCEDVARLPDVNCDGVAAIVVLGDSLVAGIGDSVNRNRGGYVSRTQALFPDAQITGNGVPGLRTRSLLKRVKSSFSGTELGALATSLVAADLVVLDLGRNDRWLFGLPAATLRNLQRIRSTISDEVTRRTGESPVIVQPVLMLPNRGSQGPWVKELNDLIIKAHSPQFPCDLRFDRVSKRLLAEDNIHPTSKGYAALAKAFRKYLLSQYPRYAQKR